MQYRMYVPYLDVTIWILQDMAEKKGTEIIMEEDEMEDGSIFVCFMCEQEFNKVSLLNDHMKLHQDVPGQWALLWHRHFVLVV